MLFKRQKTDWLLAAVVLVGIFLYASYQPRFRLRTEMPPEFVDLSADPPPAHPPKRNGAKTGLMKVPVTQVDEAKIARVYWDCLVDDVQWRYGYGHSLPNDPPAEFNVGMAEKNPGDEDAATRLRYWHRAQRFWYIRSAWSAKYEWNFDWTTNSIQNGGDWLHRLFQHLGGD